MQPQVPFKKRKLYYEDDGPIPTTENIQRRKCAKLDDGLAIKYNKLMFNFDKIFAFKHFRRYCVFFDIFSKRHMINHSYRLDMLKLLNCFDFTPYAFETCYCNNRVIDGSCTGFLLCFRTKFMLRKRYSNHVDEKSEIMKSLYRKHSQLHEDNNFYDNRINEVFRQRIMDFEHLHSMTTIDRKTMRLMYANMCDPPGHIPRCPNCKNLASSTDFGKWRAIRYINAINVNNMRDYVIKADNTFLVPNYSISRENINTECTRIVVYKTTEANIVFNMDDVFYVINSKNILLVFPVEVFKTCNFYCNFNFYFVQEINNYKYNNYIHINII